jgi:hypothetical protein
LNDEPTFPPGEMTLLAADVTGDAARVIATSGKAIRRTTETGFRHHEGSSPGGELSVLVG